MARIYLDNAAIEIPIFNANSRSLKSKLIQLASGGKLFTDTSGRITVRALENLTFSINDGERVGLVGHNGAGKSSLLRLLNGVYTPTHGQIHSQGQVTSLIDISLGIDHEATGRENIYLRGALLGLNKKEIYAKLDEIISFSELGDFIDMPVRTYSSGMHLRLAFSVSTLINPEILLMDEWLSVGDENFKHKAEVRMHELLESTKILVLASHSRQLIEKTCSRVLWLEHGKIKMDGPVEVVTKMYFG